MRGKFLLIFFLLSICQISQASASDTQNIEFPSGIKTLEYLETFEYELGLLNLSCSFTTEEVLHYEIIDLDKIENTFTIAFNVDIYLTGYKGIIPIGIDFDYKNGTIKRNAFSKHRSVSYGATRIIDMYDGKVLSIKNEYQVPLNITFIYRYEDKFEEKTFRISVGVSDIGYVPFVWKGTYEDIESEIFVRSTSAGTYECVRTTDEEDAEYWHWDYEYYYDRTSGICIISKITGKQSEILLNLGVTADYEKEIELIKIESGRNWDNIKIYNAGQSSDTSTVGKNEYVWFQASYNYDDKIYDESKGNFYINDIKATWNDEQERWEIECSSDDKGVISYTVTKVEDEIYGITEILTEVNPLEIEWKGAGIPGFPIESIFLGILTSLIILIIIKRMN